MSAREHKQDSRWFMRFVLTELEAEGALNQPQRAASEPSAMRTSSRQCSWIELEEPSTVISVGIAFVEHRCGVVRQHATYRGAGARSREMAMMGMGRQKST